MAILGRETSLERPVRVACEAGFAPAAVVVGAEWEFVLARSSLGKAITVVNEDWTEGMASSIRSGIKALKLVAEEAKGALLMTCDQPSVTVRAPPTACGKRQDESVTVCGKKGCSSVLPG
jgi:molybdenum cofactor cytidylyltransferase